MAPGAGGGEEPGVIRVLGMFSHQQFHRLLGDGDLSDGILGLWPCHDQAIVLIFRGLLADGDGFIGDIQVLPPQGHQFAFSDAADQLQIEHGQGVPSLCCVQVGFQVLGPQGLHLLVLRLGHHAPVGGIADQQPFLHCPVQGTVEHGVDAPHGRATETGLLFPLLFPRSSVLQQVLVELLNLPAGELVEFDMADSRPAYCSIPLL